MVNQTDVPDNLDLTMAAENEDGRFPGVRRILISNDLMRDHKLNSMEPRLFRRWCSCHIVNCSFSDHNENGWEQRYVDFFPTDFSVVKYKAIDSLGGEVGREFSYGISL